ncbi:MAG: MarR family transcriptional regulator [bacterium]
MEETMKQITECIETLSGFMRNQKNTHFMKSGVKDLTLSQLDLMAYLYKHKKVKMSDLAKHAGVKLPSMTETVNKLVSFGVLKREHNESDRRTVWVHVTKNVEQMVCSHIETKKKQFVEILGVLSNQEKKQALNILKKIQKKMERE